MSTDLSTKLSTLVYVCEDRKITGFINYHFRKGWDGKKAGMGRGERERLVQKKDRKSE
jgi:hypothetical protein